LAQRHADHAAPCLLGRLADRFGHLARLARTVADAALAVADDDDRGKAKAAPALNDLGDAVDADELFGEFAFFAVARLAVAVAAASVALCACHARPFRNRARPRGRRRRGP